MVPAAAPPRMPPSGPFSRSPNPPPAPVPVAVPLRRRPPRGPLSRSSNPPPPVVPAVVVPAVVVPAGGAAGEADEVLADGALRRFFAAYKASNASITFAIGDMPWLAFAPGSGTGTGFARGSPAAPLV